MPELVERLARFTLEGARLQANGKRRYRALFVKAGKARAAGKRLSDIEVSAQALQSAWRRGLFDGRAVFMDHAGLAGAPSLRNLVGVTAGAVYEPSEGTVYGEIILYYQAQAVAALLDEILAQGEQAPDIGLSLVFWAEWSPPQGADAIRRVAEIRHVESIDLVFEPAAGGKILQALSAAWVERTLGEAFIPTREGGLIAMDEQVNRIDGAIASQQSPGALIAGCGLPLASRERLSASSYLSPEEAQAAIEAERQYLARLQEDRVVEIGGVAPRTPHISLGLSAQDQLQLAFEALLSGRRPPQGVRPLSGIRELYLHLSGDYEMAGVFHAERVQFANVNSSTMANMTADALNKAVANEFAN
jgi:hypothetical protein